MPTLFLSHATAEDAIVRALQQALERQGTEEKPVHVRIDSRELVGGDALLPTVAQRIRDADAFLVLVSPAGLQSSWVGRELTLALQVQQERGRSAYRVIPLALDGHGVYDRAKGLGGLCFEDPGDLEKLDQRRHQTVYTDDLGPLLRDHRIPLVFLEACQTALAEEATESVASELLKVGVAGVVAMTHSVLIETARRFVRPFYGALAAGERIGDAMLAAQRALKDDDARGQVFGAGQLRLKDWFVPVLYQEQADPQLFTQTPAPRTVEQTQKDLVQRLGALPAAPATGFIGRSRELLALERGLRTARWALICGQGGEGKTALAVELARWRVRSGQAERAAFVSVETHSSAEAVLDALGRQLVAGYSVTGFTDQDQALLAIERALREQATLIVLDNLESLLPRTLDPEAPALLVDETADSLQAILALAARLHPIGETRQLLTSREPLPAPFDRAGHRQALHRLSNEDALALIERVLNAAGSGLPDAEREAVEALIDAVQGHARALRPPGPQSGPLPLPAARPGGRRAGGAGGPLAAGHGAVCRLPRPTGFPEQRAGRDPDGAGAGQPAGAPGVGRGGRRARGGHRPGHVAAPAVPVARPPAPSGPPRPCPGHGRAGPGRPMGPCGLRGPAHPHRAAARRRAAPGRLRRRPGAARARRPGR